jgi:hypothetical protein
MSVWLMICGVVTVVSLVVNFLIATSPDPDEE